MRMERSAAINSISRPVANVLVPASSSMWARNAILLGYRGIPIKSRWIRPTPKVRTRMGAVAWAIWPTPRFPSRSSVGSRTGAPV